MSEMPSNDVVACLEAHCQYLKGQMAPENSPALERNIQYTQDAIDYFQSPSRKGIVGIWQEANARAALRIAVKTSLHEYRRDKDRPQEKRDAVRLGIRALKASGEKIERRVVKEFMRLGQ